MKLGIMSNFGGILRGIEDKTGTKITTLDFSKSMPISYNQARRLRADQTKRFDADTIVKFIVFCSKFGVPITPNDIFKVEYIEEK